MISTEDSSIRTVSVISRHIRDAVGRLRSMTARTFSARSACATCRAERLTDIVKSAPSSPTCSQRATVRHASASAHSPTGMISPVSSASPMNASGLDQPELRVLPPQQRLAADAAAGRELDDGLDEEAELVLLDRALETGLEVEPARHRGAHLVVEDLEAGLAVLLRLVHRGVGVPQQRVRRAPRGADRDPEARGERAVLAVDAQRRLDDLQQPGRDLTDLPGRIGRVQTVAEHRELVATEARHHVARPHRVPEARRRAGRGERRRRRGRDRR